VSKVNKKEIILFRQTRRRIVEICQKVYLHRWGEVNEYWMELKADIHRFDCINAVRRELLDECDVCIAYKNYLRFYDLLVYEVDSDIAFCLASISKEVREQLSVEARRRNEEILRKFHYKIFALVHSESKMERIACSYTGNENVSIYIKEKESMYKLFSSANPWLESINLLNNREKEQVDEICVLGFCGGHLVAELARLYPQVRIKVYLPCIDIFKKVIEHIPICEILRNNNVQLCFDPTCLHFFMNVHENTERNKRFRFYINRPELRACVGDTDETEAAIWTNTIKKSKSSSLVGREIERFIQNL